MSADRMSARDRTRTRTLISTLLAACAAACVIAGPMAASAVANPHAGVRPEVVGAPVVGERLVCYPGSWSGNVQEFLYEWVRDGTVIPPQTNQPKGVYEVQQTDRGHQFSCIVTAVGAPPEGSERAESSNSVAIPGEHGTAPENTAAPVVSPTSPKVGEALSCSPGSWTGSPAPTFSYQWLRDEVPISSATQSTYAVTVEDEGHSLMCKVTASNSAGTASKLSNKATVAGSKPRNTSPPQLTGTPEVGQTLTCLTGTWTGSPTFAYQWFRDTTKIELASGSIYTVVAADELHSISCKVLATNSSGTEEAPSSNSVKVAGSRPENTAPPKLSGTPAPNSTLSCDKGTWNGTPAPTFTYEWVRDRAQPGEILLTSKTSSYTVVEADRGHSLSCQVTASNGVGEPVTVESQRLVVPVGSGAGRPTDETLPQVVGTPLTVGTTLKCEHGSWKSDPAFGEVTWAYQWLRDGAPISGETQGTYTITVADEGHSLSCSVAASNSEGTSSAVGSANHAEVPGASPQSLGPPGPKVSGPESPNVGQVLTCLPGAWSGQPAPTFEYEWLRSGSSTPISTGASYTVTTADRGELISCRVIATNSGGKAEADSNSLHVPGSPPQNLELPQIQPSGGTLVCTAGTWSGAPKPTLTYQWLREGTPIPLETEPTYTVKSSDSGRFISCRVTAQNREGSESAASKPWKIQGVKPLNLEAPQVSGAAVAGETLKCVRGVWEGKPPPVFAYRWLRDGVAIASRTQETYTVETTDQGHLLSCEVIASNNEGTAEVESANHLVIKAAKVETQPGLGSGSVLNNITTVKPGPTVSQILASLATQLTRALRGARIGAILKAGSYTIPFRAPVPGTLELSWYQVPKGAHVSARVKPVLVARTSATFAVSATKKYLRVRLTSAGRHLLAHSHSIKLTFKAVFSRPHKPSLTWLKTFVLSR